MSCSDGNGTQAGQSEPLRDIFASSLHVQATQHRIKEARTGISESQVDQRRETAGFSTVVGARSEGSECKGTGTQAYSA